MKKCAIFSIKWMVLGAFALAVVLLPGAGAADEMPAAWSSQYSQTLELLSKTDNGNWAGAEQCRADDWEYLLKKLEYYVSLDSYIKKKKKKLAAEGISISVISKDDLLFIKGYGCADKKTQTPVTPSTLFGVGSVSKVLTGIAIMQLVEQGSIDLDAPLENYIPDFGYKTHFPGAGPITVRTLMTHQSGLVGDIFKGTASVTEPEHHFRELVDYFKDEYLAYPPGYISTYSNCAVALLGIVIEEVSGVEFKTYIQNNICEPLSMITSNFSLRDYMIPMLAKSYDGEGAESPFLYIRNEPAGSFISNTLEMSLFMRMILDGGKLFGRRILKQSTLEQMFVQQNGNIELDFPHDHGPKWGLSWMLACPALAYAGKYVGHSGGIPHYYTQMHILPEHGLAVIVETNSLAGDQLSADVADMAMIKALAIFKGIRRPSTPPLPPMVSLTQAHIQQMEGTYATNLWGVLSIYPDNNRLFAISTELANIAFELKPHADNWFSLYLDDQPAPGFENLRITVKNGERERFVGEWLRDSSGPLLASAIGCEYEIPEELPPEWVNRVGQYSVINPDSYAPYDLDASVLILPSGVLYYTIPNILSVVLDPIYEDEAILTGRGRNLNQTIQVVDCNGEECLYCLGYLFKKQSDVKASPENRQMVSPFDLKNKGREIEKELTRRFRFPGLN